jgi:hypothetical protein
MSRDIGREPEQLGKGPVLQASDRTRAQRASRHERHCESPVKESMSDRRARLFATLDELLEQVDVALGSGAALDARQIGTGR